MRTSSLSSSCLLSCVEYQPRSWQSLKFGRRVIAKERWIKWDYVVVVVAVSVFLIIFRIMPPAGGIKKNQIQRYFQQTANAVGFFNPGGLRSRSSWIFGG